MFPTFRETPIFPCIDEKTAPSLLSVDNALKKSTMSCEDDYEDKQSISLSHSGGVNIGLWSPDGKWFAAAKPRSGD